MQAAQGVATPRFLRKTTLGEAEANTNFKMLDNEVGEAITSAEADRVTPLMSKIYTRLLLTPCEWRESERVLRFAGEEREGKWITAWQQLCRHLRVSSETANKALRWMHEQGIIGYYAGKNGVGIRVFLNRAASSVMTRSAPRRGQKILSFGRAANDRRAASTGEAPFRDSYAVRESSETEINSPAPESGAEQATSGTSGPELPTREVPARHTGEERAPARPRAVEALALEEVVGRLKAELEPAVRDAARQAAALEHARTREWLETRGLPKAARVAQHEAYGVLRRYGLLEASARGSGAQREVGRGDYVPPAPRRLSSEEVCELAQACLAMLEAQGHSIEQTLSEMSAQAGGFLLPEDATLVRARAESLLRDGHPPSAAERTWRDG